MAGEVNCSRCELESDGNLPGDVMVSILCNLPVNSLLKFKSVSKPWYSLISNPRFIKLHLHSQPITANKLILSSYDLFFGIFNPNHSINNTTDNDVLVLESPPVLTTNGKWIIDSCNGLVCLHSFMPPAPRVFILWNPATRKYRTIPLLEVDFDFSFCTFGLCYVESTNDFKIVGWVNTCSSFSRPYLCVYSLSSDSWKKFNYDSEKSFLVHRDPTFMNGCMHWLLKTCSSYFIASFDVTDGIISNYVVPDYFSGSGKSLNHTFVIRGCLSIEAVYLDFEVMEFGYELWVMEEYGVEGSWVKLFTINRKKRIMFCLVSWNDGEIVFIEGDEGLTFCDPFSKKKYSLDLKSFRATQVLNYVESLENVGMTHNLVQTWN